MYFLIEYCRIFGELLICKPFEDYTLAAEARLIYERKVQGLTCTHEVVILEADSEAALRTTHGRYFLSARELMEAMREAL